MGRLKRRKPKSVSYDIKSKRFKDERGLFVSEIVARFYKNAQSQKRRAQLEQNYLEQIFDEYAENFDNYFDDVSEIRELFFRSSERKIYIPKASGKSRDRFVPKTPHKHLITKKDTKTKFKDVDEYLDYFADFNAQYMEEEQIYG